jgi:hypothetical protein
MHLNLQNKEKSYKIVRNQRCKSERVYVYRAKPFFKFFSDICGNSKNFNNFLIRLRLIKKYSKISLNMNKVSVV